MVNSFHSYFYNKTTDLDVSGSDPQFNFRESRQV